MQQPGTTDEAKARLTGPWWSGPRPLVSVSLILSPCYGQREEAERENNRKIISRIEGIVYTLAEAAE